MYGKAPHCLTCTFFLHDPTQPKTKAVCTKYLEGIPDKIYWNSGDCSECKVSEIKVKKLLEKSKQ